MLAVQLVTVLAALLAYFQLRRQVALQRQEMQNTLRPLVVVQHARFVGRANGYFLRVHVQNVGPGPALDVEIFGWPRPLRGPNVAPEVRAEADTVAQEINDHIDEPELLLRLGALGPRQEKTEYMALATNTPPDDPPPYRGMYYYIVKYRDVYDRTYPTKPHRDWKVGHVGMSRPRP